MTSQSRSRTEYLIPKDNIIVLDWYCNLTNKSIFSGTLQTLVRFFNNLVALGLLFGPPCRWICTVVKSNIGLFTYKCLILCQHFNKFWLDERVKSGPGNPLHRKTNYCIHNSVGFRGEPSRPLPALGDGLTPSLTVLLICDRGTVLWRHRRHFYMILRIFKMIAISVFVFALERTKFVFGRVFEHPGPYWGAYSAPRPLSGLKGPTSKEERRGGRMERGKVKRREGERRGGTGPPFANSWIRPCKTNVYHIFFRSFPKFL